MSSLLTEGELTVCLDFSHLPSYLALAGLETLVKETGIELNWLPLSRQSPARTAAGTTASTTKTQDVDPLA